MPEVGKRRNITDDGENKRFDNELKHTRTEMRGIRRNWQRTKTLQTKRRYLDMRDTYKKMIRDKKMHISIGLLKKECSKTLGKL